MDDSRWHNLGRARAAYLAGSGRPECLPHEAFLEVSARCNLRCRMCAIAHDTRYRPGSGRPAMLEPELFRRVRPLFPTLLRAYLYGLGEPVLNRHLVEYVAELADAGVEPWFTTNATLIDDSLADRLGRAGAHRVSVSLDGITPATYEAIRLGARFDDAMRGLAALCDARHRHGRPRVTVNVVGMASNLHELVLLAETVIALGVEELNVEPLFGWHTSHDLERSYGEDSLATADHDQARRTLQQVARVAHRSGVHFSSYLTATDGSMDYRHRVASGASAAAPREAPCGEPWSTVFVTTAGEIRTCCLSDRVFGEVGRTPIDRIWRSDAYAEFRGTHAAGLMPAGCESCAANGRARISPHLDAVEAVIHRPFRLRPAPAEVPGWALENPADSAVVTDPLVVTGGMPRVHRGPLPELAIDDQRVGSLRAGFADDGLFAIQMDVPYLTEGVHILSLVGASGSPPGWSRRRIRFRRRAAHDGEMITTGLAAIGIPSTGGRQPLTVTVDGTAARTSWSLSGRRPSGGATLVLIDLSDRAPGLHAVDLAIGGAVPVRYHLFRLDG